MLIVVFLAAISALEAAYITELTDDNFYEYVKDKNVVLVDFYAPWCSDCKNLDPEINKAADTLETRSGDIAKVDCFGAGKGLCEMYRVKSWPQVKLFRKGNYIGEYTGAQTGDAIALYVESLASQSYENQVVPANVAAAGQQMPYQAQPVVPGPGPMAAVPASQPQMQQPQKVSTPENSGLKVEAHAKATIHKNKGSKKSLSDQLSKNKLKKIAKVANRIAKKITKTAKNLKKAKGKGSAKQ
ncbi:uncharacterized protein LOC135687814 [Rhopilema esculentum]|uniref:uncharacterized protein LOC135687814 n=1 Tax=Rhopilema esculentum TaxID=499914 RepID=UPI0031D91D08